MSDKGAAPGPYKVLFLCTGNAARSILAEALLNHLGAPRFRAYSAGSRPKDQANPHALALLQRLGVATDGLRPKSWDAFAAPGAPALDLVFTLCDHVAGQACPAWPGRPVTAHWSLPDPTAAGPSEAAITDALADTHRRLHARLTALCALPIATLDRLSLQRRVDHLG